MSQSGDSMQDGWTDMDRHSEANIPLNNLDVWEYKKLHCIINKLPLNLVV